MRTRCKKRKNRLYFTIIKRNMKKATKKSGRKDEKKDTGYDTGQISAWGTSSASAGTKS